MSKTRRVGALRVHSLGGPDVLAWDAIDVAPPTAGEVLLRHTAIGLNFIDVYFRTGLYPGPEPPFVPGVEAVGVIEELGAGVDGLAVGDRVGYAGRPLGAYAEARTIPADRLVPIPDGVSDETAAAVLLKGMTARMLLRDVCPVQAGDAVLVHAAAGGVGTLLAQWAAHLGAYVIGTVGSPVKAPLARANGCRDVLLTGDADVAARVRELTDGGARVVYDSVGADTLRSSLDSLAPRGMLVSFGQSSGLPAPLEIRELLTRGSLFLTRPSLLDYTADTAELRANAAETLALVASGALRAHVGAQWPLREAADAQAALEGRRTSGATLLLP